MDKALKQRLVGASVLIILAVIVLPMLLSGRSDTLNTESPRIELPPTPNELSFETRRFPVGVPDKPVPSELQQVDERNEEQADEAAQELPERLSIDDAVEDQRIEDQASASIAESPGTSTQGSETDPGATGESSDDAALRSGEVAESVTDSIVKPPAVTTVLLNPKESTSIIDLTDSATLEPRYLVQVASFSSGKRANTMADQLRAANLQVVMDVVDRTAGRLHRVRVGPYVQRDEADAVVVKIRSMNKELSPRIVDTRPSDTTPVSAPSDPLVRWVVQVGSYSSSKAADAEVAKLQLAGLTAFSERVVTAGNTAYKVRIGPEIDRERAIQLKKDIKAKHNIDGFVTTQE